VALDSGEMCGQREAMKRGSKGKSGVKRAAMDGEEHVVYISDPEASD
jgi:hypothetical protein